MREGYLTLGEAAEYSKVSRVTIWKMVKEGRLRVYADPRDRRVKLVRRDELDAALQPVPLEVAQAAEGKEAA